MPPIQETPRRLLRADQRFNDVTMQVIVVFGILLTLLAVMAISNRNFFQGGNLRGVSRDWAIASLLALGQAVVIIGGGIDLSVGSMIAFCGVLGLKLIVEWHCSLPASLAITFGTALLIGLAHGLLICRLNLQPFLVTLCSLLIFRSLARVLAGDSDVTFAPADCPLLRTLGHETWNGVPIPVFILVAVMIPLGFFLHCTVAGRYLFAVGGNLEAARFSGIRVDALRTASYMICSLLAAAVAFLQAGDVSTVAPSISGTAYEMFAITGAVLGGCALSGGQGSLLGVVAGVAILRILPSSVVFINLSDKWTLAVTGFVLLAAVISDSISKRRRARS